jgi:hypothetical protein
MTQQASDILRWNGERLALLTFPLEALYKARPPRPHFIWGATDIRRGYLATWLIEHGKLCLVGIEGKLCTTPTVPPCSPWACPARRSGACGHTPIQFRDLCLAEGAPVLAEWFTGQLQVAYGPRVQFKHLDFFPRYETYLVFSIQGGLVTKDEFLSDEDFYGSYRPSNHAPPNASRRWWQVWK